MTTISLHDALREMEKLNEFGRPIPFSVSFLTCPKNRAEGSRVIELKDTILTKHRSRIIGRKRERLAKREASNYKPSVLERNQQRNFYIIASGEIRRANIRLITKFNNAEILP